MLVKMFQCTVAVRCTVAKNCNKHTHTYKLFDPIYLTSARSNQTSPARSYYKYTQRTPRSEFKSWQLKHSAHLLSVHMLVNINNYDANIAIIYTYQH